MTAAPESCSSLGVTPPISTSLPNEYDIRLNEGLIAELRLQNNFEPQEGVDKRVQVLFTLQKITEAFIQDVCRKKGYGPGVVDAAGGKIYTFGSYRLGVYGPGATHSQFRKGTVCLTISRVGYRCSHSLSEMGYAR